MAGYQPGQKTMQAKVLQIPLCIFSIQELLAGVKPKHLQQTTKKLQPLFRVYIVLECWQPNTCFYTRWSSPTTQAAHWRRCFCICLFLALRAFISSIVCVFILHNSRICLAQSTSSLSRQGWLKKHIHPVTSLMLLAALAMQKMISKEWSSPTKWSWALMAPSVSPSQTPTLWRTFGHYCAQRGVGCFEVYFCHSTHLQ